MADPRTGRPHKRARRIALAALVEGTPCPMCRLPMYRAQSLDLDHVIAVAFGGADGPTRLVHSTCNRSRGASLGNAMRTRMRTSAPLTKQLSDRARRDKAKSKSLKRNLPQW